MKPHIRVERALGEARKRELGIVRWPVWEKAPSRFEWFYEETETCLIIAGEVIVTPREGEAVNLRAGDLACFPAGLECVWEILQDLRKHYRFG